MNLPWRLTSGLAIAVTKPVGQRISDRPSIMMSTNQQRPHPDKTCQTNRRINADKQSRYADLNNQNHVHDTDRLGNIWQATPTPDDGVSTHLQSRKATPDQARCMAVETYKTRI